jgi:membrane fusion protein (multidrug efflux system)
MALLQKDQRLTGSSAHLAEHPQKPAQAEERPQARERVPAGDKGDAREAPPGRMARLLRKPIVIVGLIIIALALIAAGVLWWLNARQYVSTDDAFIDARPVQISSQVSGDIVDVPVTDNQVVVPGAPLAHIDPSDYRAAVARNKADLEQAQASVANFDAQIQAQNANIAQAKTQVTQSEAALEFSRQQNTRAQNLLTRGAGTEQQAQQTSSDLTQKQAAVAAAKAAETAAEKQLGVLNAQRESARAQVDSARAQLTQAEINLTRTDIVAPQEGRVARLTAAKGAYAQPGQALMVLVPRKVWVTANFKETELTDMRPGQPVDIEVDAYPDRVFHGHVDSIQAGSGAVFTLLPPENATGNYVKVVQRVPVKIVFDNPPDVHLGPGMSVVPTVKVR